MKPKSILFLIGFIVLLMGAVPLILEFVPAAAEWKDTLPTAGSIVYQSVLVILGIVAIGQALKKNGKEADPKAELIKLLSK